MTSPNAIGDRSGHGVLGFGELGLGRRLVPFQDGRSYFFREGREGGAYRERNSGLDGFVVGPN